MQINLQLLIV